MTVQKLIHIAFFFVTAIILLSAPGCEKDYSYERVDSIIVEDSVPPLPFGLPACRACNGVNTSLWKWNFKNGNSLACGIIDTAIMNADRTGFTFFGPSTCSVDTGMVITVYLSPLALNGDRFNMKAGYVAFYYYDNVTPSHILISRSTSPFSLTIDSYIHQTGLTTGKFTGYVFTEDGRMTLVDSGKFQIVLK